MKIDQDRPGPGHYTCSKLDTVREKSPDIIINPESKFSQYNIDKVARNYKKLFAAHSYTTYKKSTKKKNM